MFHHGNVDPRLPGYTSDGFNNEAKIRAIRGQLFVFWASEDDMMPPDFALRMFDARYAASEGSPQPLTRGSSGTQPRGLRGPQEPLHSRMRETRMACIQGWHCTFFGYDK